MCRYVVTMLLMCSLVGWLGCVSKTYVRNQVTPVIDKVNLLDEQTAETLNQIKRADKRSSQGIESLDAKNRQATASARDAEQQAMIAQQASEEALQETKNLVTVVFNVDEYELVKETSVHFASGKSQLGRAAEYELNTLGAQVSTSGSYVVTVQGRTDSTGNKDANYTLSEERADVVARYLATKCNIPVFKMHVVGLGADNPAGSNDTSAGRAENRRAEVRIYSHQTRAATLPNRQTGSAEDDDEEESTR
jgi:OmpA-OmpF porin, OOP family